MRCDLRFPVLVVASDGWLQVLSEEEASRWNCIGVSKYNRLQPLALDSDMRLWRITKIKPKKPITIFHRILAQTFYNPQFHVKFEVDEISEKQLQKLQEEINKAINADDDILTQWVEAEELKDSVDAAKSFKSLLTVLKKKRVI
jgi:hypothetical protein